MIKIGIVTPCSKPHNPSLSPTGGEGGGSKGARMYQHYMRLYQLRMKGDYPASTTLSNVQQV